MFNLNVLILKSLENNNFYGLEIIKYISEQTNGQLIVKQPSLYSALRRFENKGFVSSYWQESDIGGMRHYYNLTDKGKEYLKSLMPNGNFEENYFGKNSNDSSQFQIIDEKIDNNDSETDNSDVHIEKNEDNMSNFDEFSTELNYEKNENKDNLTKENDNDDVENISKNENDIDYRSILGDLLTDDSDESEVLTVNQTIKNDLKQNNDDNVTSSLPLPSNNENHRNSNHFKEIEAIILGKKNTSKVSHFDDIVTHFSQLPRDKNTKLEEIGKKYFSEKKTKDTVLTTEHYGKIDKNSVVVNKYQQWKQTKLKQYLNINKLKFSRSIIISILMLIEILAVALLIILNSSLQFTLTHYIIAGCSFVLVLSYFITMLVIYKNFPDKKIKKLKNLFANLLLRLGLTVLFLLLIFSIVLMFGIVPEQFLDIDILSYWLLPALFSLNITFAWFINILISKSKKFYS